MKTNKKFYNFIIVVLAIVGVYFSGHIQQLYISAIFISAAFIASFFVYKKTFPFIMIGLGFYWYAIMKDIWGGSIIYDPGITRSYWTVGNVSISIGIISLMIEEFFPDIFKKKFGNNKDNN
jgi:hypothetical protein